MNIVLAADLHLSPYIWKNERLVKGDSYRAFMKLVNSTLNLHKKENTILIIAGDIFDVSTPDAYTEKIFADGVNRLHEVGISVYAIQGNHDKSSYPRFAIFGVIPLNDSVINIGGISLTGIDYTPVSEELKGKLAFVPKCDILVLHTPFKHLLSFEGQYQLTIEDIPDYIPTVITGDIHVANIKEKNGVTVISPGTTHPRKISEITHDLGAYVLNTDNKSTTRIKTAPRVYMNTLWKDMPDLSNYTSDIDNKKPVVAINYNIEDVNNVNEFIKSNKNRFHFIERLLSRTVVDSSVTEEVFIETIPTMIQALSKFIDYSQKPEEYMLLEELLKSPEIAEEILNKFLKNNEIEI